MNMSVYSVHAWCLWESGDNIISLETGVASSWELLRGGWEQNPGCLQKQQVS